MSRSVVVLLASAVFGLSSGLALWLFVGALEQQQATPELTGQVQPRTASRMDKPPEPRPPERQPPTKLPEDKVPPEPTAEVSKETQPDKTHQGTETDTPPVPQASAEPPPAEPPAPKPVAQPDKPSPPKARLYPIIIDRWRVTKKPDGCMATLPVNGATSITSIERPESVGLYLFHARSKPLDGDGPDQFGFIAPGRGEMTAKLTSENGAYVRGVNSNTGLLWSRLVMEAQNGMDLALTTCGLDGECKTHNRKLDIADLEAASAFTLQCARDKD